MERQSAILEIRTYKLVVGKRDEFDRIVHEHAPPMLGRYGIDVVRASPSLHDDEQYVLIRSFRSLDEREEQLERFYGSAEWLENYDERVMKLIGGPPYGRAPGDGLYG